MIPQGISLRDVEKNSFNVFEKKSSLEDLLTELPAKQESKAHISFSTNFVISFLAASYTCDVFDFLQ